LHKSSMQEAFEDIEHELCQQIPLLSADLAEL
jgi:hypothetical protein